MYDASQKTSGMSGRTFVSLAGAILMVVLLNGGIAIFGLFYSAEKQAEDQNRLDAMFHSAYGASRAEIFFKHQVQDWKNILLRGSSSQEFEQYRQFFEGNGRDVDEHLRALLTITTPEQKAEIESLLAEHGQLEASYRAALSTVGDHVTSAQAATIDQGLRGVDRPFTARLDQFTARIHGQLETQRHDARQADIARYKGLKQLNMAITGVGALLVLGLLLGFRPRGGR